MPQQQILPFAENLRQARLAKRWSQRNLGAKAGLTQAHLSRIERGEIDPRLSTLLELARLLDLEVVLTPRNALTAVHALIREAHEKAELRTVRVATTALNSIAAQLRSDFPRDPFVEELTDLARDLYSLTAVVHTRRAMMELAADVEELQAAARAGLTPPKLRRYLDPLKALRNSLALARHDTQHPAYSLHEEND